MHTFQNIKEKTATLQFIAKSEPEQGVVAVASFFFLILTGILDVLVDFLIGVPKVSGVVRDFCLPEGPGVSSTTFSSSPFCFLHEAPVRYLLS